MDHARADRPRPDRRPDRLALAARPVQGEHADPGPPAARARLLREDHRDLDRRGAAQVDRGDGQEPDRARGDDHPARSLSRRAPRGDGRPRRRRRDQAGDQGRRHGAGQLARPRPGQRAACDIQPRGPAEGAEGHPAGDGDAARRERQDARQPGQRDRSSSSSASWPRPAPSSRSRSARSRTSGSATPAACRRRSSRTCRPRRARRARCRRSSRACSAIAIASTCSSVSTTTGRRSSARWRRWRRRRRPGSRRPTPAVCRPRRARSSASRWPAPSSKPTSSA